MGRVKAKVDFKAATKMLEKIGDSAKDLGNAYVTVGVHSDAGDYEDGTSLVTVALANEFGTKDIPERSFLRSTFIGNRDRINKIREEAVSNCMTKGWGVEKALSMIGTNLVILIQNRMRQGIMPPNAPSTLAQKIKLKQGTTPLIRLGSEKLIRSITYKVVIK